MTAKQIAAIGVRTGRMFVHQSTINPTAPKISDMPMKRIRGGGKPSTPVCPLATNFCSEKIDLFIPEYINIRAVIH